MIDEQLYKTAAGVTSLFGDVISSQYLAFLSTYSKLTVDESVEC